MSAPKKSKESDVALEKRLVKETLAGNSEAFAVIYRRHVENILGLCNKLIPCPLAAEDVCQTIFLRAFQALAQYRGNAPFAAWLQPIAVNAVLMYRRNPRNSREIPTDFDSEPNLLPTISPDEVWIPILWNEGIRQLAPGYRTVFMLYIEQGWEHKEIAEMIKKAEGTSKSQLRKARIRLKKLLFSDTEQRRHATERRLW